MLLPKRLVLNLRFPWFVRCCSVRLRREACPGARQPCAAEQALPLLVARQELLNLQQGWLGDKFTAR